VDLVAINPQTSGEACLKTFNMFHVTEDERLVKERKKRYQTLIFAIKYYISEKKR
jgi:hypothetical protein